MEVDEETSPSENSTKPESKNERSAGKRKPGIIYLSTIPKFMNVTKIRELFGQFGELGRVFLQPSKTGKPGGRKSPQIFSEGWIEYKRKRVAKQVALHLNNKQMEVRKKSKFCDFIWNIKYLPRFKWIHLSERLAYEKAAHRQRLRLESSQARKETNYFALNVDKSEIKRKKLKKLKGQQSDVPDAKINIYNLRKTDSEIMSEKRGSVSDVNGDQRTELLKAWFGGSASASPS